MRGEVVRTIEKVARRWADPDYEVRDTAVDATLQVDNRFTEQAIAFAINQQMGLLKTDALIAWRQRLSPDPTERGVRDPALTVGVLNAGNLPFAGLQDLIAVLLSGFNYVGTTSSKSPYLMPAFASDLMDENGGIRIAFDDLETTLSRADAVIASGTDETMEHVAGRAGSANISNECCWLRGHRYSVAVLDGKESREEREALAEDALLHEGMGCRSVALVFAPNETNPDPYLESMAEFRGAFPAPEATRGRLKMQQAFLEAVDRPHAFADDYQFLISRGEPDVQGPAHVRWSDYEDITAVGKWLDDHRDDIQTVLIPERLKKTFPDAEALGDAQRPALDWRPDGGSHEAFFKHIRSSRRPD